MSPVEIRVEKGLSRAGFLNPSGMTETIAPSGTVDWVGRGEKPQARTGSQAGRY